MRILKKNYVKNIIAAILFIAGLTLIGNHCINNIYKIELKKSSYTRTLFDLYISKPGKAQVDAIESDGSVDAVFPYYSYKFSANEDIALLISDDIADSDISVLTPGTLIEGDSSDKSGAMLDKRAADALGVTVGDTVTFRLLGEVFTKTVSAIYLPTQIPLFDDGVIIVDMTEDMAAVMPQRAYSGAFIRSNNIAATEKLLQGYVGEGNVNLTYEEYSENIRKFPEQTQEEYEEYCRKKYEEYRAEVLASVSKAGQITRKSDAYALVKTKVMTMEKEVDELENFTFLSSFGLFCIGMLIIMLSNKNNDEISKDNFEVSFKEMFGSYILSLLITSIAIAGVSAAILNMMANNTYFPEECRSIVLSFSLSTVIAVVPSMLFAFIRVKLMYLVTAANNGENDE